MGTRSLTVFTDETQGELAVMYRQFDGNPSGHGKELCEFLSNMTIVNGYSGGMAAGTHANGMGCLAAQVVAHFKNKAGLGGIYLYPAGTRDVDEEYIYFVSNSNGRPWVQVLDAGNTVLYGGTALEVLRDIEGDEAK